MKTRHVIAIGILSAITIGLIAFGLKTKNFKKPILTSAEDLYPISKKWLFNKNNITGPLTDTTINFTSWNNNTTEPAKNNYTKFTKETGRWGANSYYERTGPAINYGYTRIYQYVYGSSGTSPILTQLFLQNASRIIEFETEPTGDLYTILNSSAQPAYNSDILLITGYATYSNNTGKYIYNDSTINEIRKGGLHIEKEDVENGTFINTEGTIQLFLDAGCSSLKINGTEYINSGTQTINITNDDIVIQTAGTNTGNTSSIFTINYFNTRPPITPQPYPDPGDQVIEVIPIVPMMFQILTMPFTFITTAFNVTLWEGTPYEFNFSNFIYSLIAIATLIFIIKLFTSGFSVIGNYTYNKADKDFKKSQTRLNNAKAGNIERNAPKKTESKVTIKKE